MSGQYVRFGSYRVYECLGAGGMATVHRALLELEDGGEHEVALKRLLPQLADDKRFVEDFVREGKLAAQLDHQNIIRILEVGRCSRVYFMAMELVRGCSLHALLRHARARDKPAPIGAVLSIAREVLAALAYAHDSTDELGFARRIVHRDLTPSNLLVTDDGHIKIIDFGIAKALSGQFATSSGVPKGKLGYMSLEAISGKDIDARADVFSVGVVLWELIVGRRLFRCDNDLAVIEAIRQGRIDKPSARRADCPRELDDIVMRAVARDRNARWPSAAAMGRAIEDLVRYYKTSSTVVAQWKESLRGDSFDEDTIDSPIELAEGSLRDVDVAPEKFKDADTIVSRVRDDD